MSPMLHFACCCDQGKDIYGIFAYQSTDQYMPPVALHYVDGEAVTTYPTKTSLSTYAGITRVVKGSDGSYHAALKSSLTRQYYVRMLPANFGVANYEWEKVSYTTNDTLMAYNPIWSPGGVTCLKSYGTGFRAINLSNWNYMDYTSCPTNYSSSADTKKFVYPSYDSPGLSDWCIVIVWQWRTGTSPNYVYHEETWLYTGSGTGTTSQRVLKTDTVITSAKFSAGFPVYYNNPSAFRCTNGDIYMRYADQSGTSTVYFDKYASSGGFLRRSSTTMGFAANNPPFYGSWVEDRSGGVYYVHADWVITGLTYNTYRWRINKYNPSNMTFGADLLNNSDDYIYIVGNTTTDPVYKYNEKQKCVDLFLGFTAENEPIVTSSYRTHDNTYVNLWAMKVYQDLPAIPKRTTVFDSASDNIFPQGTFSWADD